MTYINFSKGILHKHAPLKMRNLWVNQTKFMTKELEKAIMDRSSLGNK